MTDGYLALYFGIIENAIPLSLPTSRKIKGVIIDINLQEIIQNHAKIPNIIIMTNVLQKSRMQNLVMTIILNLKLTLYQNS